MRTDMNSAMYEACSNLPFGDSQQCSGGDPSPNHFTGKQRDTESNLDDFGARYFSSQYGRWMSPDWSASPEPVPYASLTNPQSLNLYAYVGNNPITGEDRDGHMRFDFSNAEDSNEAQHGQDVAEQQDQSGQGQQPQNQSDQPSGKNPPEQKPPSSWKPGQHLPNDPSGLGSDWHKNPDHKNPNGEELVNDKTGEKVEFGRGRPGQKGWKGDDHWHYTPPGGDRGKEHIKPGDIGKLFMDAGHEVVQTVKEHPVAAGVIVGSMAIGATILTGGAAAPSLAFIP